MNKEKLLKVDKKTKREINLTAGACEKEDKSRNIGISYSAFSLIIFSLIFAFSAMPAFATQCLTDVDGTTSVTTNVTTGTSVQISVTPTGSCSSGEISSLVLTYSNCTLTITDPASGQYSSISTGSAKTFTVTSGSQGVCTITARGTTSDGSVDDNTPVVLEFIDPSTLTVAGSPSSTSVTFGNSFSLDINVTNAQASSVLTSYTLSLPSGLTRSSGDPASSTSTTVDAGSTKVLAWTIQHSTCFTGSKTITFQLGDNTNAFSTTVTGNSTCGTTSNATTTSSSGGGGGGGATDNTTVTFLKITPGAVSIQKITNVNIPFKEISIEVNNEALNVKITVVKLAGKPASVTTPAGTVFHYLDVVANIDSSKIKTAKIKFRLPKSTLVANGFAAGDVFLLRFSGGNWQKLTTSMINETATEYEFESVVPGFSTFAIAAEKPATPAVCGNNAREGSEECDGSDMAGQTCVSRGYAGGTLRCATNCVFDASLCTTAGQPGAGAGNATGNITGGQPGGGVSSDILYGIVAVIVIVLLFFVYHNILKRKGAKYEYKGK